MTTTFYDIAHNDFPIDIASEFFDRVEHKQFGEVDVHTVIRAAADHVLSKNPGQLSPKHVCFLWFSMFSVGGTGGWPILMGFFFIGGYFFVDGWAVPGGSCPIHVSKKSAISTVEVTCTVCSFSFCSLCVCFLYF